jgi:tetratricopeptide (TPR) repeat protein
LKRVSELHPKYARAINEIGIVFGGSKKQYDEAILWYKKCTDVTPQYASCYNNIGVNY